MARGPHLETDLSRGGRITSLRSPDGFEWLWTNPRVTRTSVKPGANFVDAGGAEECFPTIAGVPDHGDVWTREWHRLNASTAYCSTEHARLTRSIRLDEELIVMRYRVDAPPGYRFVWAFHALINPSYELLLRVAEGEAVLTWPSGYQKDPARWTWPQVGTQARFDDMTRDDGTAEFALLLDRAELEVQIGARFLCLSIDAPGLQTSVGVWRNLRGYAWDGAAPYRSIGIEPMLGQNPNRDGGEGVVVPSDGYLEWTLRLRCGTYVNHQSTAS